MKFAYYNEFDPFAAECLRALISKGLVADGEVDTRSIIDVAPEDTRGFAQCHFFAGIGGWSRALRLAGVPDNEPIWTGSCPCQPFSQAGKGKGDKDARHLWPEFARLIRASNPATVFGEQVASKAGREWLAGVFADLEGMGYRRAGADLCAASAGAPHIRQRLWWVADSGQPFSKRKVAPTGIREPKIDRPTDFISRRCNSHGSGMADSNGGVAGHGRIQSGGEHGQQPQDRGAGRMGDSNGQRRNGIDALLRSEQGTLLQTPWASSTFIPCTDNKLRRVPANEAGAPEPALFPLAYGIPNRVGTLRGSGNAIVPEVAAIFVKAYLEC